MIQMQDLALGFVESHDILLGSQLSLSKSIWMASYPLRVLTAAHSLVLTINLLNSTVRVTDEIIQEHWFDLSQASTLDTLKSGQTGCKLDFTWPLGWF